MSKNNFTNENEFDFKFDIYDDIPELERFWPNKKWMGEYFI